MTSLHEWPVFDERVLIASSHSTAGAVPSCGGFACVACSFKRPAKGKIMRRNLAQIACRGKCLYDGAWPDLAEQRTGQPRTHPGKQRTEPEALRQGQKVGHS